MDHIESNKGDFSILKHVDGKSKPEQKTTTTSDDPEWMIEAQRKWLSVMNDFLFEPM